MTLEQIYKRYDRQSDGFARAVERLLSYRISRDAILRISERAPTANRFIEICLDEDWWQHGDAK